MRTSATAGPRRSTTLVALCLWLLFVLAAGLGLLLQRVNVARAEDVIVFLAFGGFPTVGLLLATRRPSNRIGWIMLAMGLVALGVFTLEYARYTLVTNPGSLPGGEFAAGLTAWVWVPTFGQVAFLLLLFPDGRMPSPRWRPVGWLAAGGLTVWTLVYALTPGPIEDLEPIRTPLGLAGARQELLALNDGLTVIMTLVAGACAASLLWRFRRAGYEQRQQLKWFVFAAGFMVVNLAVGDALPGIVGDTLFALSSLALSGSIGVAIFKYRLTTSISSSIARSSIPRSPGRFPSRTSASFWYPKVCSPNVPRAPPSWWPPLLSPWPRCSALRAGAFRMLSISASTGAGTTPCEPSTRSVPAFGTRSTSTR